LAASNTPTLALRNLSRWGVSVNSYKALAQKDSGQSAFLDKPSNLSSEMNSLFSNPESLDTLVPNESSRLK
jgi:hypothetical protein